MPAPVTFSVFGAAKRKLVPADEPDDAPAVPWRDEMASAAEARREVEIEERNVSEVPTAGDPSRLQHASSTTTLSISTAAPKAAPTDLRAQLQARLTAEYRTALANRTHVAVGKPLVTMSLRDKLHSRLKAEKATAAAALDDEARRELSDEPDKEWWGNESYRPVATTFSEETRALLLARLEEIGRAHV